MGFLWFLELEFDGHWNHWPSAPFETLTYECGAAPLLTEASTRYTATDCPNSYSNLDLDLHNYNSFWQLQFVLVTVDAGAGAGAEVLEGVAWATRQHTGTAFTTTIAWGLRGRVTEGQSGRAQVRGAWRQIPSFFIKIVNKEKTIFRADAKWADTQPQDTFALLFLQEDAVTLVTSSRPSNVHTYSYTMTHSHTHT